VQPSAQASVGVTGYATAIVGLAMRAQLSKEYLRFSITSGLVAINAAALNAAMRESIFAVPDARLVIRMAFPRGSTRALATAQLINF